MTYHQSLSSGRWAELTLAEQLGNVGSEVSRMISWREKDQKIANKAFERMLELLDLTLATIKEPHRLRELTRARELLVSGWLGSDESDSNDLHYLNQYFFQFALLSKR